MVFSSISFLFYFLPAFLAVYFLVPDRAKNGVLFVASLLFYSWGEGVYVLLLLGCLAFNYACGRLLDGLEGRRRKAALDFGLAVNLSGLIFFKYAIFLLGFVPSRFDRITCRLTTSGARLTNAWGSTGRRLPTSAPRFSASRVGSHPSTNCKRPWPANPIPEWTLTNLPGST